MSRCFLLFLITGLLLSLSACATLRVHHQVKDYIVDRKIDLQGEVMTLPEGKKLVFKGKGLLCNGTLVGQNTQIVAEKRLVMDNITIDRKGIWRNTRSYPEWFGACDNQLFDSKMAIQKAIDVADTCVLTQNYYMAYDTPTRRGDAASVCAIALENTVVLGQKDNKINIDSKRNNTEKTSVFWVGDNVVVDGVNIVFFNTDYTGWTGIQAGVYRVQGSNVTINNTSLRGAMAAWINIEGKPGRRNYHITNNYVHDCDCGLIIQGSNHRPNDLYNINLLMANNIIEKEKNRHSEMVSFWGSAKDGGKVYYTNVIISGNKFSGGWQGGCITGHPKYNGLRDVTITDNDFYDCGACTFYNTEGLVYERNYVTGSSFIERQVKGEMGSYPNLSFINCEKCLVNDVSCFGITFSNCKDMNMGKIKQTLCLDEDDQYLAQKDYITNFIGIRAENSTISIDDLIVNPFNKDNATTDKCRYYIFKAVNSEVNVGKMQSNIPVQDSKRLLKVKEFNAHKL